jgi:hypothetical protein
MDPRYNLVSSADRDRASDLLRTGLAEGRLDAEEFNNRIARLFSEVRTYDELWSIIQDQPDASRAMPITAATVPVSGPTMPTGMAPVYYPQPRDTNGFAIASFVCSVLFLFTLGLGGLVGVVFGHIARHQLRQRPQGGNGLSIAGLIIGYIGILYMIIAAIGLYALFHYGIDHPVTTDPSGGVKV